MIDMMIDILKEIALNSATQDCKNLCPEIDDCFNLSCPVNVLIYDIDKYAEQKNYTMLFGTALLSDELGTNLAGVE